MPTRSLRRALLTVCLLAACLAMPAVGQTVRSTDEGWQPLFDGKTLSNWQPTKFSGHGEVKVDNGTIVLESGNDLTGITWSGAALPTTNYEITLQAMRVEGSDFFAGITFPGRQVLLLPDPLAAGAATSSASRASTIWTRPRTAPRSRWCSTRTDWYTVRIRVTPDKIEAWLDDRHIITQESKGNRITTRMEVEASQPLGIASWRTKGALRDIRLKKL